MKYVCEIRRDDFVAAIQRIATQPTYARQRLKTTGMILGCAVLVGLSGTLAGDNPFAVWCGAAAMAIGAATFWLRYPSMVVNGTMKILTQSGVLRQSLGRAEFETLPEGLRIASRSGYGVQYWALLHEVSTYHGGLLIALNASNIVPIPRDSALEGSFEAFAAECEGLWRQHRPPAVAAK